MKSAVFTCCTLAWLTAMGALAALGPPGRHPLAAGVLVVISFVLLILMMRHFPDSLAVKKTLLVVFILGVAGRALFLNYPVGNDVYRYVWEGYVQNAGFNPYRFAPDSPELAELAGGEIGHIWTHVNHKDAAAAYPPLALLLFRILAALRPDPFFFKTVLIGFDLAVMAILALMLRLRQLPFGRLLLYALNPLVILYGAGEGHLDVVQIFFLCLGLYGYFKGNRLWPFFSIGLAVMTKYLALAVLPFLISRHNWKASLVCLLPWVLFLFYWEAGFRVFHSLGAFGLTMHYNDGLTTALRFMLPAVWVVPAAAAVLLGLLAWIFLLVPDRLQAAYLAVGAVLLCLPTLHPWYLIAVAPFLIFYPSAAWFYLQAAMVLTFPVLAVELQTGIFQEIHWVKALEYGPFFGILVCGIFRDGLLFRHCAYPAPRSVSVVIPTLNESENIEHCITSLRGSRCVSEIIVSDGGSTDQTPQLARRLGAKVVCGRQGRGIQIREGIAQAAEDLIMVLHADCVLQPGVPAAVLAGLGVQARAPGGAVGMRFAAETKRAQMVALLNNLRARLTGIAFGDQAQFVRRSALESMGGYPALMLMEDVELSLRLKELGRPIFLKNGVVVSNRRWQGRGFDKKIALVFKLFLRYLIQRRLETNKPPHRDFYAAYYSDC